MNIQYCLIRQFVLQEFERGHNAAEAIKNISFTKDENTVEPNWLIRWFWKFLFGCKNLDDKARLGRPKTMDPDTMLLANSNE